MRQTAKHVIDWLGPSWEARGWEESGKENRNRREGGGQLETPAHRRSAVSLPPGMEDREEAQRRRLAVLLVLELLMWLETSADMDMHGSWGGVHGVAQLIGVNNRRHFSLWTKREEDPSSRDQHKTHASSWRPQITTQPKTIVGENKVPAAQTLLPPPPTWKNPPPPPPDGCHGALRHWTSSTKYQI